jgi:uncharacterized protein YgbK (DUF1537 family)
VPPDDVLAELARRAHGRPAIVLDDDPTGTQTLRDVFVLTSWTADAVARHLDDPVVFLSTNSRSLDEAAAVAVTRSAVAAARAASVLRARPMSFISRSDSTLRGHFPAEVSAIADASPMSEARVLLAPYFGEGGRITVDDVHYLERDGVRTPVAETEFASDATFGYRSSDLRAWVAEKYTAAGLTVPALTSVALDMIRDGGPDAVSEALRALPPGGVAIGNAEMGRDIEALALGALLAEEAGLPLVARTAASYVRARAGRAPAPLLEPGELEVAPGGGLVVVGSHVATTTRQLERLFASQRDLSSHELPIEPIVAGGSVAETEIDTAARAMDAALRDGRLGVVATEGQRRDIGLEGGRLVSSALVAVVERVTTRPAWIVSKGGITSYDIAAHALGMGEALVAGQLLPGVPVWIGGDESRWPGVPLVVFPGNVGDDGALLRAIDTLH